MMMYHGQIWDLDFYLDYRKFMIWLISDPKAGAASYDEMASGENYVSNNFISVREFA